MEIAKYNFEGENNIEFLHNSRTATVYFEQGRFVSKIKKLKERCPDEVEIVKENKDGSIVAHIPTKWIRINPSKQTNMTEEQRQAASERMKELVRKQKG